MSGVLIQDRSKLILEGIGNPGLNKFGFGPRKKRKFREPIRPLPCEIL